MAGHSKWANIKHRKGAQDAKRGKVFTKLIKEITVAARLGGGDVDSNPRLRLAIDKALSANMTKDTIARAVKRGAGGDDDNNMIESVYEGYGINGVAVMVECLSDNKNRTVADVRHSFTKFGGNMGTDGSVAYLFTKKGIISFEPGADEDQLMEIAIEAGAEDVNTNDDGSVDIETTPENMLNVKEALTAANLTPAFAEVTMEAATSVDLDAEQSEKLQKMLDWMEDLDDVQEVYTNANFADD
ncbi:MAG: YebC/PmpR family DNA-binding transcriptional regulator [Coxiellaceae bacterium]|nr:YebC/PmpR family DNA-binding transcriptional regulator [Coxiellaceae bacterium]